LCAPDDRQLRELEDRLLSFDADERGAALAALWEAAGAGEVALPPAGRAVNLHYHTFFSYNSRGYSPSSVAWLTRKAGLGLAGIVDFDVLDGLEEFISAGRLVGQKTCAGLETRVYVPEFAAQEINSPGEPGIAYHLGLGFPSSQLDGPGVKFLAALRRTAEKRNRSLIDRVNGCLEPVTVDYDREVLPLTPAGNATERHICLAYARKAQAVFSDRAGLGDFWSDRLGLEAGDLDLPDGVALQSAIRTRTMKRGGVGYVQPDGGEFPDVHATNRFILENGGLPAYAWLDGTSEGEQRLEELLAAVTATGVAAINIIPDRNYTPGVKDARLANLYRAAALAEEMNLPMVAGTEMNSPGQRFVDDFDCAELAPLVPAFLRGANIVYAHSALQRAAGLGYAGPWATRHFSDRAARNDFYEQVGRDLRPSGQESLAGLGDEVTPMELQSAIRRLPSPGGEL